MSKGFKKSSNVESTVLHTRFCNLINMSKKQSEREIKLDIDEQSDFKFNNCFLSLKRGAFETRKNAFYFTSKAFLFFFRYLNFRILECSILCRHQIPNNKRNRF